MTEEKKATIEVPAVKEISATTVVSAPQGIPAFVDSSKTAAPIVLSSAPPIAASDATPVVDKASTAVESPPTEKK